MTTVRAKFSCLSVTPLSSSDPSAGVAVRLFAVYGDGTDNASWSAATPGGQLDMSITNPAARGAFVTEQDYYLDLTPVQPPAADEQVTTLSVPNDGFHAKAATVSTDFGNLLTAGSDGLPYLSQAVVRSGIAPDADLGTIPGVTVVETEAEVDQEGGPAQAWKQRAAQAAPTAAN